MSKVPALDQLYSDALLVAAHLRRTYMRGESSDRRRAGFAEHLEEEHGLTDGRFAAAVEALALCGTLSESPTGELELADAGEVAELRRLARR